MPYTLKRFTTTAIHGEPYFSRFLTMLANSCSKHVLCCITNPPESIDLCYLIPRDTDPLITHNLCKTSWDYFHTYTACHCQLAPFFLCSTDCHISTLPATGRHDSTLPATGRHDNILSATNRQGILICSPLF